MSYGMSSGHRPMALSGAAARLEELLDQIRVAFDSVSQDVEHSKSQHNDYERRGWSPLSGSDNSFCSSSGDGEFKSTLVRDRENASEEQNRVNISSEVS